MTTKEQERKALEQIRKIVEGLGEDSYIGTAFEGCFEIAQENIDNDFACSMKQRVESLENELATEKEACDLRREQAYKLEEELKLAKQTMQQEAERANAAWAQVKERDTKISGLKIANEALQQREDEKDVEIADLKSEIVNLKAKLYDILMK